MIDYPLTPQHMELADLELIDVHIKSLYEALNNLRSHCFLHEKTPRAVIYCPVTYERVEETNATEYLVKALSDFYLSDGSEYAETERYPSVFQLQKNTVNLIRQLQVQKDNLRSLYADLTTRYTRSQLRIALKLLKRPLFNPLKAWRNIPIIETESIRTIGFTKAKRVSTIKRFNKQKLIKYFQDADDYPTAKRVADLPCAHVRIKGPVSNHIRANISYRADGEIRRYQVYASMPLILATPIWADRIQFTSPRETDSRSDILDAYSFKHPFKKGFTISC